MRSLSTRTTGLLIVALGAWGGLVPFIGHYFHFALGPDKSWAWTTGRLYLSVIPAVVAIIGGLMLISAGWRPHARLGALLAIAAGIWFAIGPDVSHLWNAAGAVGVAHGSKLIRVLEMVTYHTGLGALIAALGGYALPRFVAPAEAVAEPAAAGTATRRPVADRPRHRDEALAGGAVAGGAVAAERERHARTADREPVDTPAADREPAGETATDREPIGPGATDREPVATSASDREPATTPLTETRREEAVDQPTVAHQAQTSESPRAIGGTTGTEGTPATREGTAETQATPAGGPVTSAPREDEPLTTPTSNAPATDGVGTPNGSDEYAGAVPASAGGAARPHTVRRRSGGLLGNLFSRR